MTHPPITVTSQGAVESRGPDTAGPVPSACAASKGGLSRGHLAPHGTARAEEGGGPAADDFNSTDDFCSQELSCSSSRPWSSAPEPIWTESVMTGGQHKVVLSIPTQDIIFQEKNRWYVNSILFILCKMYQLLDI